MNEKRRERIRSVKEKLDDCASELDDIRSDEEEYRDNIPENLQGGDRYQDADDNCDKLEDVTENIRDALRELGKIK